MAAVEEGRVIYDNIRRFIKFSIAGNVGKVAVMLFAPLVGITIALLPLQLLWLNLLTDGLLGLGLGVESPERDTMKHPPRSSQAGFLSEGMGRQIVWIGALIGLVGLGMAYLFFDPANPDDMSWQTMLFTTLAFLQIGQALASRSSRESLFAQGLRSNPLMLWMVLVTTGLQLMVIYVPVFQERFNASPLSITNLVICIIAGSLAFVAIEIEKWLQRLNSSRN